MNQAMTGSFVHMSIAITSMWNPTNWIISCMYRLDSSSGEESCRGSTVVRPWSHHKADQPTHISSSSKRQDLQPHRCQHWEQIAYRPSSVRASGDAEPSSPANGDFATIKVDRARWPFWMEEAAALTVREFQTVGNRIKLVSAPSRRRDRHTSLSGQNIQS